MSDESKITLTESLGNALAVETIVVDPSEYQRPEPEPRETVIATTTDSAQALESGKPVPLEKSSLADFRELEGSGTRTTSYEAADSSRHRIEEQFAEYQADLDRLKFPLDEELVQNLADEAGVDVTPEEPAQPEAQSTEQSVPVSQVQNIIEGTLIVREHQQRMALAMQDPQFAEIMAQIPPADVEWDPQVGAAVAAQANSPALVAFLSYQPQVAQQLASMPVPRAVAEISRISAWLYSELGSPEAPQAPRRRAVSNAPAPIRPVGGSATKSSQAPGEMSYQEFKRYREKSIREHRRGE